MDSETIIRIASAVVLVPIVAVSVVGFIVSLRPARPVDPFAIVRAEASKRPFQAVAATKVAMFVPKFAQK